MTNPSLSICVITKNESRFISTCLASVQGIAHEIIVVDSGSTDDTVSLARQQGARVYAINWRNDYAWARNEAIRHCSGDWILFLDADEYLVNAPELLRAIRRCKDRQTGGYLLERTDVYRHKESGLIIEYPVGIVRLFRNGCGFQYEGAVHEQINMSISSGHFNIAILKKSRIVHQVFMNEDDFLEAKQLRYLELIDKELEKQPANYWMLYQRAKTCWFLNRKKEAELLFGQLGDDPSCPLVIRCSGYGNKAVLLLEEKALPEALAAVNRSLSLNPEQSLGQMIRGNILYAANRFPESIQAYRKVKTSLNRLQYNQVIPGDLYTRPEEKKYKIACCYLAMGKTMAGHYLLRRAVKLNPAHAPSLLLLAKLMAQKKRPGAAAAWLARCLAVNPGWKQALDFAARLKQQ